MATDKLAEQLQILKSDACFINYNSKAKQKQILELIYKCIYSCYNTIRAGMAE